MEIIIKMMLKSINKLSASLGRTVGSPRLIYAHTLSSFLLFTSSFSFFFRSFSPFVFLSLLASSLVISSISLTVQYCTSLLSLSFLSFSSRLRTLLPPPWRLPIFTLSLSLVLSFHSVNLSLSPSSSSLSFYRCYRETR